MVNRTRLNGVSLKVFFWCAMAGVIGSLSARASEESMLKVGTGKAKFNAILQTWAFDDTTAATNHFGFKIRRAELKFAGEVVENSRWFLMLDPAKALSTNSNGTINTARDNKILVDFGIAFTPVPSLELVMGQFKIPTTAEGLDSSGELLLPERSYIGRTYGLTREPGFMVDYKAKCFELRTMISNGNGANVDDTNDGKDLHARADYFVSDTISAGAFTTAGDFSYAKKARWGANLRWIQDAYLARIEGVRVQDAGTVSNGWTADAAYRIHEFQPVLRYDGLAKRNGFTSSAVTGGMNYFLMDHHTKIQLSYTRLMDMNGGLGSYSPVQNQNGSLWILALQAAI